MPKEKSNNKTIFILIVCRGNIIRSPFAEKVIDRNLSRKGLTDRFTVFSRGIQGTSIDPIPVKFPNISFYKREYFYCKSTLEKYGIDIIAHKSKPVDKKDMCTASVVFAIDQLTKNSLIRLFPGHKNKIYKLSEIIKSENDFADPENLVGIRKHSEILAQIYETINLGFPKLLALANKSKRFRI